MAFQRSKDASYPCLYETWKTEDTTFVIQDLPPEDIEAALDILTHNMFTDEILCVLQKLGEDPVSAAELTDFWRQSLGECMSLGCYEVKNGQKTLVALNVCLVGNKTVKHELEIKGDKWRNVYAAIEYAEKKANAYEYTGLETLLLAMGLVVRRDYRGKRLAYKLLNAREPLCRSQGIKGTATVFTGVASQKPAASAGFQTIAEFSLRELAETGLPYPRDDERTLKYMIKKYV